VVDDSRSAGPGGGELWRNRFDAEPSPAIRRLSDSLSFDQRLFREDIAGSRAHVAMLAHVGLLDEEDLEAIVGALDAVEAEFESGTIEFAAGDEDIHTVVERRVVEIAGTAGMRMHTGRSRNDQVVTDMRLWVKRALGDMTRTVLALQETLLTQARAVGRAVMPGYTHLQRAQPVLVAHHLLAHGWALSRDVDRLLEARSRADVSPLGAGSMSGSSLHLDPEFTARELGFASAFENSIDAVADRDFVADAIYAMSVLAIHLARLGEEVILWSSDEFGFVHLGPTSTTGSSLMPQKRNPDGAELARGAAGAAIGNLAGVLALLKGLPFAYNKDLQGDKRPLFETHDAVISAAAAMNHIVGEIEFDLERMGASARTESMAAADLAERLVENGTPFRQAHRAIGELVRRSAIEGVPLSALVSAHPGLGPEAVTAMDPDSAVSVRTTRGSTGLKPVAEQIARLESRISFDTERL